MQSLLNDLRYALRSLRKAPAFTTAAVVTLALGISVNTAIFSVINTVLIRRLPYKDSDRIVLIYETEPELPRAPVTLPDLLDWRQRAHTLQSIAAVQPQLAVLSGDPGAERIPMLSVTVDLFDTLGIQPAVGRKFTVDEGRLGRNNVVILSDSLFRRRYGGDPAIVGRQIRLEGGLYSVIGVMPPGFTYFNNYGFFGQAWCPMVLQSNEQMRGRHDRFAVARLAPGATTTQAQAEMSGIAAQLEREHPGFNGKIGAFVVPFQQDLTARVRDMLLALLGAVGFVLLIACANVANLLLARGLARRQELAVRAALGASRWRLVRQLLTESLVLACLGGCVGLVLAFGCVEALKHIQTLRIARLTDVSVDRLVLLYSVALTMGAGILFGLLPALLQSRHHLEAERKEGGGRTIAGSGRASLLRSLLVVSELGLAVILLVGAGLMVRSFTRLLLTPLGFRPDDVLTAGISLPEKQYLSSEKTRAFTHALLDRVRAIPGVTTASITSKIPLQGGQNGTMVVEGQTYSNAEMEGPLVESSSVYPGYFKAMGIPLLAGRVFSDGDLRPGFNALIVNQTFVRVLLHGAQPLGKRISFSKNPPRWQEIIGVVADTRQHGLARSPLPEVYDLDGGSHMILVAHTTRAPSLLVEPVRKELAALDRDVPLAEVRTMQEILDGAAGPTRSYMRLLGAFAVVALVLAAIGIYSLIAFAMSQREHEIGIRLALGATPRNVIFMILSGAAKLVSAGLAAGIGGALLLTGYLKSLLYEVSPFDPLTFAAVALLLAIIALTASFVPARRATSMDPYQALRHE